MRKTTTTTVVHSDKDKDGNWREYYRVVTQVTERDDDGYPYGPSATTSFPYFTGSKKHPGQIGDYFGWYGALRPRSADKKNDTPDA